MKILKVTQKLFQHPVFLKLQITETLIYSHEVTITAYSRK